MKRKEVLMMLVGVVAIVLITALIGWAGGAGVVLAMPAAAARIKKASELKQERSALAEELQGLIDTAEKEEREFNETEDKRQTEILSRMDELDAEIATAEKREKLLAVAAAGRVQTEMSKGDERDLGKYSLLKAMRSLLPNQKLDGIEAEMHQEALNEARSATTEEISGVGVPTIILDKLASRAMGRKEARTDLGITAGYGGDTIPTEVGAFINALRAKMVLGDMGATYLTGLQGNLTLPRGTDGSFAWEGETDANADAAPTTDKLSLSPHRVGGYVDIGKQLMFQSSISVENWVMNYLTSKTGIEVEAKAINGSGSSNQPTGILNTPGIGSVAGGTDGAAPTWAHVVKLEKEVAIDNADVGKLGYITNPAARGKLKTVQLDAGSGLFVWDRDNMLNGYRTGVTTNVPSNLTKGGGSDLSALIFGNFEDLVIAQWGGLDMVIDGYTQAANAQVRIVINSWWDVALRWAQSFAAMKDIITT